MHHHHHRSEHGQLIGLRLETHCTSPACVAGPVQPSPCPREFIETLLGERAGPHVGTGALRETMHSALVEVAGELAQCTGACTQCLDLRSCVRGHHASNDRRAVTANGNETRRC